MASENKGKPLPKFGEWDVNNPASAEGFTVIFSKASDEKKTKQASGAGPGLCSLSRRNGFASVKTCGQNSRIRKLKRLPERSQNKKWIIKSQNHILLGHTSRLSSSIFC